MGELDSRTTLDARTRDHLANERTYLSWLRTAATVMVLGLAVAKFINEGGPRSLAAGGVLVATGAVGLVYAAVRYRATAGHIEREDRDVAPPASRTTGPLMAGAVLIVAVAAAFVLMLG